MKTPKIYFGAIAVFCVAALVIGTAGAATMTHQWADSNQTHKTGPFGPEKMTLMLSNLTAKGYDVSAIQTAVTNGDFKTAMTLLQQFRTAHPDAFPARVAGTGNVTWTDKARITGQATGQQMTLMLSNLTAKGYDVSAIQTAVTNGDFKTAMTLLQQFRTAHPDAFPARVARTGNVTWAGRGGHRTTN
jgi:ABC-type uncharacterized transport system substrate-binding protein